MVPDPSLSLSEGAVAPFKTGNYYPQVLRAVAQHMGVSPDTPWEDMPAKAQKALLHGLGKEKVRVDYVTVDGRETYWYIEWKGRSPPSCAATRRRRATRSARSWRATSPRCRARRAAGAA